MKRLTIITALILSLLSLLLLGGCMFSKEKVDIQNEDQAREYILERLEQKYGEEFVSLGSLKRTATAIETASYTGPYSYSGKFAPKNDTSRNCDAATYSDIGGLIDDYSRYVFKAEAERYCAEVCDTKEYIDHYSVELFDGGSSKKWKEGDSIKDYLGAKSMWDPYDELDVWLKAGYSDAEYAVQIKTLYDELNNIPCAVQLQVFDGNGERIFWYKIETGKADRYFELADIERYISDDRRENMFKAMQEQS
jgi:hypothetical protein